MNTRFLISTLTLGLCAAAGIGSAQAAAAPTTAAKASEPTPVHAAAPATHHAAKAPAKHHPAAAPHHAAHASAMDRMHQQVAFARSAEQRHWIDAELHRQKINTTQASSLRTSVAAVEHQQSALTRRGHETFDEALGVSHRQDVLDWSIRTGNTGFEPQQLLALG
jgi:hypothetical protein